MPDPIKPGPKLAATTSNPAQAPQRQAFTPEQLERARHEKTQRALTDSQEQVIKHASDAAFKAGQLDQKGKGRLRHYCEAYAQVFVVAILIGFIATMIMGRDHFIGWLAVKEHQQGQADAALVEPK